MFPSFRGSPFYSVPSTGQWMRVFADLMTAVHGVVVRDLVPKLLRQAALINNADSISLLRAAERHSVGDRARQVDYLVGSWGNRAA